MGSPFRIETRFSSIENASANAKSFKISAGCETLSRPSTAFAQDTGGINHACRPHQSGGRQCVCTGKVQYFEGLKLRVIPDPVYLETFKALKANPIPMPFAALSGALESNLA
jgi:hypothetical protein